MNYIEKEMGYHQNWRKKRCRRQEEGGADDPAVLDGPNQAAMGGLHWDHWKESCECYTEEFGFASCITFLLLL